MTPTDPVRELERRTAAGEVAPLADPAGHGDWHRSFHDFPFFGADARAAAAARRQLRLRLKLGVDRRPCDPLLAAFRKRCVEHGGERDGLGALLAEDSLAAVILLLPDLRFEETLCVLADDFGPIPENLFARSRTVGDLLSGLGSCAHAKADDPSGAVDRLGVAGRRVPQIEDRRTVDSTVRDFDVNRHFHSG